MTVWQRRSAQRSQSPSQLCCQLGPPCLPATHSEHARTLVAALTQCPAHAPSPAVSFLVCVFFRLARAWWVMPSPPGSRQAGASWPCAAAPLATRLHVADGRAAGHVLGMGWRAGDPQAPSLCPEAPHLTAGTASGWGLSMVGQCTPPSQELPWWGAFIRSSRMAKFVHHAGNQVSSCPRRGWGD